jgi:transposase
LERALWDYKRNGTTSLFAAMNILDGTIIGTCMERHRHQEWIKFLNLVKQSVPEDRDVHLICDNYATHKHPNVKKWLDRNKRFHVHFTPTSASWLNMIERFFRDITCNRLKRGIFRSVEELVQAIMGYLANHNESPKPFIWTATAQDILEKVKRGRATLNKLQSA